LPILRAVDLDFAHVAKRKPPPKRDECGAASRQLPYGLRALRIARPRLIRDGRRIRGDGLELLPGEPPRLVELVHAHVDEDAAAVAAEIAAGWPAVPLVTGNGIHAAEAARGDVIAQANEHRH